MLTLGMRIAAAVLICLTLGCSPPEDRSRNDEDRIEGTEPGDCTDGADNDGDGAFDCDDDGCAASPDCEGTTNGRTNGMPDNSTTNSGTNGRTNGATNNGTPNFETVAEALDRLVEVTCSKALECCDAQTYEKTYRNPLPADETACESDSGYRRAADIWAEWESDGSVEIDLDVAATCLEAFATTSCADIPPSFFRSPNLPECEGLFTGTVEAGETCERERQCVEGHYCSKLGECKPRVAGGEACGGDDVRQPCDDGFYCFLTCEPQKQTGEACDSFGECETEYCSNEDGNPGTCFSWCE